MHPGGLGVRHLAAPGVLLVIACGASTSASHRPTVTAALIEWSIGTNQPEGPSPMIETIVPASYQGKKVWRVVHRGPDPVEAGASNNYDMYDVEQGSLQPLRGIMNREGFYLGLSFNGDRVQIDRRAGDDRKQTEVVARGAMPEGPGVKVLLGGLPLAVGYRTAFPIVDRWAKDGTDPVKWLDLIVVGKAERLQTPLGSCEVYEVTIAPRDGSFRIREWVRVAPPRYPVKTEYVRGELTLISEVTRMVLEDGAPACSR